MDKNLRDCARLRGRRGAPSLMLGRGLVFTTMSIPEHATLEPMMHVPRSMIVRPKDATTGLAGPAMDDGLFIDAVFWVLRISAPGVICQWGLEIGHMCRWRGQDVWGRFGARGGDRDMALTKGGLIPRYTQPWMRMGMPLAGKCHDHNPIPAHAPPQRHASRHCAKENRKDPRRWDGKIHKPPRARARAAQHAMTSPDDTTLSATERMFISSPSAGLA